MRTEHLQLSVDDQIADRYLCVPFELPVGSGSLEVRLSYDISRGVIDLGCEGPHGWRGWSGGARDFFVIDSKSATPGYLSGELEAGVWQVVLGLHKLPAEPLEVTVEIRNPAERVPATEATIAPAVRTARGSDRNLPAPYGLRWYAGDFHAHTVHSDGTESIDELAARGVRAGLDFVAVTDHNTVSHHPRLPLISRRRGITLLPGQEVTTHRGHANAFGDIGFIDFRRPAASWVTETAERGGILSINHPADGDCAWQHPLPNFPGALELWHISWFRDLSATSPWAIWQLWDQEATLLGGSDFHRSDQGWTLGTPTTWVAAEECTTGAILEGIRAGRTAISVGVDANGVPQPLTTPLLLRIEEEVLVLDAAGTVLVDVDGRRRRINSDHQTVSASWGRGPLHLQDTDRRLLAIG